MILNSDYSSGLGAPKTFATEEQFQQYCFTWFWNEYPAYRQMVFHIDNNSVNAIVGAKKRSMGVTKGISDFIFVCGNRTIYFVELKLPGRGQKREQKTFEAKLREFGHIYIIINTFEEFKRIVEACYGKGLEETRKLC